MPTEKPDSILESRRQLLINALRAGVFMGATGASVKGWGMAKVSKELPPGRSIYDLSGEVTIDGVAATLETQVKHDSVVKTGSDGEIIFAVGKDAFLMRSDSTLRLEGNNGLVDTLNLLTGKLLSVFGKTTHTAKTVVATIGIRGTGIYMESEPDRTYICTCYGIVDLESNNDSTSAQTVKTTYHDAPRYILADAEPGQHIIPAPVINHTDAELVLVEELVGRLPPFGTRNRNY
ncbi:MAG: hypothetical protein AAF434_11840 [Pseudomonadota bacterium]